MTLGSVSSAPANKLCLSAAAAQSSATILFTRIAARDSWPPDRQLAYSCRSQPGVTRQVLAPGASGASYSVRPSHGPRPFRQGVPGTGKLDGHNKAHHSGQADALHCTAPTANSLLVDGSDTSRQVRAASYTHTIVHAAAAARPTSDHRRMDRSHTWPPRRGSCRAQAGALLLTRSPAPTWWGLQSACGPNASPAQRGR